MISGAHVIIYSADAEADRAFFRDVLGFPSVDAGQGWLIFALPPAEIAFHPAAENGKHTLILARRRQARLVPAETLGGSTKRVYQASAVNRLTGRSCGNSLPLWLHFCALGRNCPYRCLNWAEPARNPTCTDFPGSESSLCFSLRATVR